MIESFFKIKIIGIKFMITVVNKKTFFGPNPYSSFPIVLLDVNINKDSKSSLLTSCKNLCNKFPNWLGDLKIEENNENLYITHIIVKCSFYILNEIRGYIKDYGLHLTNEGAKLWVGFHEPDISIKAVELVINILETYIDNTDNLEKSIEVSIENFWKICRVNHPDFQARILMTIADKLDIPFIKFFKEDRLWQFGWGNRSRIFFESCSNEDGFLGSQISTSKLSSKILMKNLGIPTPDYEIINSYNDFDKVIKTIGFPCVTKPLNSGGGKGVTANINSIDELKIGFDEAKYFTNESVMVERFVEGDDYRIMVIEGKFNAVIKREPPFIIGNGKNSVEELIHKLNEKRSLNKIKSNYLVPIFIDKFLINHIKTKNINLQTILANNMILTLRSNANLSTGGVCTDCTSLIHPDIKLMAETIAQVSGIEIIGVDYLTTDISKSYLETKGSFTEFNKTPGLDLYFATQIDPFIYLKNILGDKPNRIPFSLVIVNEKDLDNIKNEIFNTNINNTMAWLCDEHTYIGKTPLISKKSKDWSNIEMLLKQPTINSILCICTMEDIMEKGMPVDKVDVVYKLNIQLNNIWDKVFEQNSKRVILFEK